MNYNNKELAGQRKRAEQEDAVLRQIKQNLPFSITIQGMVSVHYSHSWCKETFGPVAIQCEGSYTDTEWPHQYLYKYTIDFRNRWAFWYHCEAGERYYFKDEQDAVLFKLTWF